MARRAARTSSSSDLAAIPGRRAFRVRRRYHFGPGGLLYIFVTLLVALGAFNSQNNLLYWTFGFALALLLVSGVVSGAMLMGVRIEREWVSSASVGDAVRVRYRVRNVNRLIPAFALTIEEAGLEAPAPPRGLLSALFPRRLAPEIFDRPITQPRAFVAHVGHGETVHAEAVARALRRGAVSFGRIIVHTSFPFGLLRKSLEIEQHGSTVVTPLVASIDTQTLRGSARMGQSGSVSRRPGRGEEFFALREYVHGDSPRDVAWRASAKRGSLLVRQFAAPAPQRMWIVLHLRATIGSPEDDEQAIRVAAGLAHMAEAQGMEYALAVPLTRLIVHPRRGGGHLSRLMTDLGLLELGPDDGRGSRCAFPPQAAGAYCVVVHSGRVDTSFAPAADQVVHVVARAGAASPALSRAPTRTGEPAPAVEAVAP